MNICVKNKVNGNDGGVLIHEAKSPPPKKHSLSEIIKLNETFNLRDIWRVRNPNKKLFTFRQKHFTGIRQQRLDYIFVSNSLQESVKKQK